MYINNYPSTVRVYSFRHTPNPVAFNLVRNYSPHLPPNTRSAPTSSELRRILQERAVEMLENFLKKERRRRIAMNLDDGLDQVAFDSKGKARQEPHSMRVVGPDSLSSTPVHSALIPRSSTQSSRSFTPGRRKPLTCMTYCCPPALSSYQKSKRSSNPPANITHFASFIRKEATSMTKSYSKFGPSEFLVLFHWYLLIAILQNRRW